MAGIIVSIARMIGSGTRTFAAMAEETGLTREQFLDRLALMERQGYIIREEPGVPEDCSCGHCCASCNSHSSGNRAPAFYVLTRKGETLARETTKKTLPDPCGLPLPPF